MNRLFYVVYERFGNKHCTAVAVEPDTPVTLEVVMGWAEEISQLRGDVDSNLVITFYKELENES